MKKTRSQKSEVRSQRLIIWILFCFLFSVFCFLSSVCFAQPVSSSELIERAKEYDGKIVSFQGEAIGDIMQRENFCWINVNDGVNAVGIWLKTGLTKKVTYTGSYKFNGDTVLIQGKFNRACLEHGGDLDIHAGSLMIIKSGFPVEEKISVQKYKAAIGFLGVVLCFGILRRLKRKPGKR